MSWWPPSPRVIWTVAAMGAVVVLAAAYLTVTAVGASPAGPTAAYGAGDLMFVELADGAGRVEFVDMDDPDGAVAGTGLSCLRVHTEAGVTVCLAVSGPGPTYTATITATDGRETRVALPGVPSRAKVSTTGRIVTWTSFVTGDSYTVPGGFSTRTGFLDVRTGAVVESIEHFAAQVDGVAFSAIDVNYWGMTVAADDRTFYATMASGERTWLVEGDLATATLRTVRPRAECPSLSPDGSSIAYKKRIGRFGPWELAVLDLATGQERVLPGTVGVDDQAEWVDDDTLVYAAVPTGGRVAAVHVVRADGGEPARVLVPDATSPAAVG